MWTQGIELGSGTTWCQTHKPQFFCYWMGISKMVLIFHPKHWWTEMLSSIKLKLEVCPLVTSSIEFLFDHAGEITFSAAQGLWCSGSHVSEMFVTWMQRVSDGFWLRLLNPRVMLNGMFGMCGLVHSGQFLHEAGDAKLWMHSSTLANNQTSQFLWSSWSIFGKRFYWFYIPKLEGFSQISTDSAREMYDIVIVVIMLVSILLRYYSLWSEWLSCHECLNGWTSGWIVRLWCATTTCRI